jgi:hypothetical protein
MSPVPAFRFSPKKKAAQRRIKRWRQCPVALADCITGRSLVARELAQPGAIWPPRPRQHYRQARTRSELARLFVDLVQEHTEKGAAGVLVTLRDLVELSGQSKSTCERAVAEAQRLGMVEHWPLFETAGRQRLARAPRGYALKHAERGKLYTLGPAALVELQRLADARRRPPGWARRQADRAFSAERRRAAANARGDSIIRDDPSGDQKPEEAPEDPRTRLRRESVAPSAPPEGLSRCQATATVDAPPLELRNSWTREAAARPPRRAESASRPPRSPPGIPSRAHARPAARFSRPPDPSDDLADTLARLRSKYAPGGDG